MSNASYGSGAYVSPYGSSAPAYTTVESMTSQHVSHTPPGQSLTQDLVGATKEIGHKRMSSLSLLSVMCCLSALYGPSFAQLLK